MKRSVAPIEYQQVRLRLWREDDLAMTLAWRNQDDVRIWFKNPAPLAFEDHQRWFQRYLELDTDFMFIVEDRTSGDIMGQVGIYAVDYAGGQAEAGRSIAAPKKSGRGHMKESLRAACDWALTELGLDRVICYIYTHNLASLRMARLSGFQAVAQSGEFTMMERFAASVSPAGVRP